MNYYHDFKGKFCLFVTFILMSRINQEINK